jgi:5'-nucleotidase
MKQILVTNDDGFDSKGLEALVDALRALGRVTVVAPTMEKSACGHSLTLTRPLRFVELDDDFFKLDDGTPTDCVFLALNKLFDEYSKPDLIVSGINKGANMGEDITYSGTASAAMEGVLQGVPSIAISQVCSGHCNEIDQYGYELAQKAITQIVEKIFDGSFPLPQRRFLNVNIPPIKPSQSKGLKITRAGNRFYGNDAHVHRNPRGLEYYWIGLPRLDWLENTSETMTDFEAVNQNYVSITPVHLDMTSYDDMHILEEWLK